MSKSDKVYDEISAIIFDTLWGAVFDKKITIDDAKNIANNLADYCIDIYHKIKDGEWDE